MTESLNVRTRRISGVISTDDIIPGRYKHMHTDTSKLAQHVFENRFPGLAATFSPNDLIVADDTFGIGSSREQAVSSLLAAGVRVVVAPRFGRIFFRNCWNLGLFAIEADALCFAEGEKIVVNIAGGTLIGADDIVHFSPPPERMLDMVAAGGLIPSVLSKVKRQPVELEGSVDHA
ncbi:3-isopropylmalate dehydratase [uncultured Ruegeria sp.]|uniref:LeuD/DmdB family oxidoreductase small subunit n=1 Tax=uncultured Ruegeria sp. TaxID=259304 RepID=UPI0026047940|nr:3-isopropylmalate dehydratase [uncultured Ruegeria sp.]